MNDKKRGGWSNPASAANGKAGGGRPSTRSILRRGDAVVVHRAPIGDIAPEEAGVVLSASAEEVEIQIGEDILVIRR